MFEKAGDKTDIFFTGDDYGTQAGPMISLAMWRKFVRPHVERLYGLAKSYGLKVMQHSCGSVAAFLPDLIECGLDIIEPVQVRAYNMGLEGLLQKFGGKLCFHGSIDTQQTLPWGTPEDVRAEVLDRVRLFKQYGGLTIAPTQHLLPEIPIENIVAMYDTAWERGWL
jgi:uroporphyrinogen decarboxylase